jgi:hypothetical protein
VSPSEASFYAYLIVVIEMQIAAEMTLRRRQHDRLILGAATRDRKTLKAALLGNPASPPVVPRTKSANNVRVR